MNALRTLVKKLLPKNRRAAASAPAESVAVAAPVAPSIEKFADEDDGGYRSSAYN